MYDCNTIVGMVLNGATYYFHRNIQGDVVGVYDSTGAKVVGFKYDAFGRCTVSGNTTLAQWCKIRYRGYYFDNETGFYWVQTRYYNPEWCRWISPDSIGYLDPEIADGVNLYAYCINDPVNYIDPSGHFIITLIGCIVGAAIGFGVAAYKDYKDDGEVFNGSVEWYDYLGATLLGGAIGAGIGAGLEYIAPQAAGALSSFANSSFTLGGGMSISASGAAAATAGITITGTEIMVAGGVLAGASVLGGIMMFAKGSGPRFGLHNQHENKMFKEAMRQLGVNGKSDPRWSRYQRALEREKKTKGRYFDTLKKLLEYLDSLF